MPTWTPPANYTPHIYYDLFPCIVTTPSGTRYEKVRFILTAPPSPRVYIFKDGFTGPEAVIVAEYDPAAIFGDTRDGFDITVTAPNPQPFTLSIRPHAHCGCGSSLKGFRPFTNMQHTAAPALAGPLPALTPAPATP